MALLKVLTLRSAALLCAFFLVVGAAWTWITRPDTKPAPRVLPKTAVNVGLFEDIFGWTGTCWGQATIFGLGTIVMAVSAPPSLGLSVAAWTIAGVGGASAADACAKGYTRPQVIKTCFTFDRYKGTFNGVKYYKGAGACSVGGGAGGGGGGSW